MDFNNSFISRFFTARDRKETNIFLELPTLWWSRFYEYIWASSFIEKDDIVLDSACGICHPFKFYLLDKCRTVYACDLDERITSPDAIIQDVRESLGTDIYLDTVNRLRLSKCDITDTPYNDSMFDKVLFISVLEHMPGEARHEVFREFHRILKPKGMLIMTCDYPDILPEEVITYAEEFGFEFAGEVDFDIPEDAIYCSHLKCFRVLLIKK